ncbi:ABC transporter ATP-binding protein [Nocardioides yefusunii]|uniref:ABC transporter ATP-binding protein n=1 Tax=Nocardioides yefusunii TaxID=2500546 RepID=A0ABW1QUU7_9ACTN|nr:ABC transporter ATP-binding protein [Nocardioides yefusunii]
MSETTSTTVPSAPETVLDVRNLAVSIRTPDGVVNPVKGVDFSVRKGEIVGVVGESGCGKSTTIKGVLNLLGPNSTVTADRIELAGHGDIAGYSSKQMQKVRGRAVGFVAQNPFGSLNPIYTIERQFFELQKAHGTKVPRKESRKIALAMLDGVGIVRPERVLDGYAHQLSGGMAQRVVIALATTLSPPLLFADEPTTGLDATVQAQILDLISSKVREEGRSMLLVTHDLGVIAQYCQRVVVMYGGEVVEEGTVHDVMVTPQHPYSQKLIGSVPKPGEKLNVAR